MNYKQFNLHRTGNNKFIIYIHIKLLFFVFSKIGKMLMARCKKLLDENEQLGKMISSDNVAKLEGEISLQNKLLTNMKDSQKGKNLLF